MRRNHGKKHGKPRERVIDDGSTYTEDVGALDEHDPNYDSEVNSLF